MKAFAAIVALALLGVPGPDSRDSAAQQGPPRAQSISQSSPLHQGPPPPARPGPTQTAPAPRATPAPAAPAQPPAVPPRRYGRFDLDQSRDQLALLPDLRDCADA